MADKASTPRQVWERSMWFATRGDLDAQLDLYAPDCVVEFPFVAPPTPNRFAGRAAIRDMITALRVQTPAARSRAVESESTVVVHETADPEVVIPEFEVALADERTGEVRRSAYIQVVRVRDGRIVAIRDYFSPTTVADVARALTGLG